MTQYHTLCHDTIPKSRGYVLKMHYLISSSEQSFKEDEKDIIIPIWQRSKARQREVKYLPKVEQGAAAGLTQTICPFLGITGLMREEL